MENQRIVADTLSGKGESVEVHICYSVTKKCWNPYDSFGEICVGCGCCSDDPIKRAEARLKVSKDHLEDRKNFNMWDEDPEWRKIQENNIRKDNLYFKRRIRYYTKRLKELGVKA